MVRKTNIDFPEKEEIEFGWHTGSEKVNINGKGFKKEISWEERNEIISFLEDEGFKNDAKNVADGMMGSLTGFKKKGIVCIIHTKKKSRSFPAAG